MDLGNVLLVEDALDMQMMVNAAIGRECKLTCVGSVDQGYAALRADKYALLILDVNLPDGDGFEFCKRLRSEVAFSDLPIVFLTGEDEVTQRVLGFDLGADDYIIKPLEPVEFKARIVSRLKRKPIAQTSFTLGAFQIDWPSQKALLMIPSRTGSGPEPRTGASSAQELALTPTEFKLLVHFLRNEGRVFSRPELLVAVWGSAVYVSGHTVDTHISSLRKKVGEQGACFKAVIKKGYCFTRDPDSGGTKKAA